MAVTAWSFTIAAIALTSSGAPVLTVPRGTAIRRSGSEMATPILDWPRSRPSTRPCPGSRSPSRSGTGQESLNPVRDACQRLIQGVGLRTTSHRKSILPADPAPDDLGGFLQELTGVDPGEKARGH